MIGTATSHKGNNYKNSESNFVMLETKLDTFYI